MSNATGANTTPLGRLNPAMNITKIQQASLLKPSYMSGIAGSPMTSLANHNVLSNISLSNNPALPTFGNTSSNNSNHMTSSGIKREREDDDDIDSVSLEMYNTLSQFAAKYAEPPTMQTDSSNSWTSQENPSGGGSDRKRKRRSRWGGDEKEKVFIPGMPTVLPNNLSPEQEKAYLLQLQIEEISRRLRTGDLGIPAVPEERSPSPEPIYNSEGKRLNTREYRTRKKLEDDRHAHIQEMFKVNPEYKPPADYKPPMIRVCEKVMIPQEEHPDINFVGLLIGPRGNTLKSMEKETGAKIIIRGKGSVKEGKVGRKDGQPLPGEYEPLHAFVTATNPEAVKKAIDRIREIIRQGVEVPEGQNDLRRMQLRELALLNGTLRENEGPRCTNCGATNHRSWQCPDKPNVTNNVICTNCGGAGHIARDCREKKGAAVGNNSFVGGGAGGMDKSKIDEEYMSLMAELGEGPPVVPKNSSNNNYNSGPSALSGPQGIPRAIMAPPPNSSNGGGGMPPPNWMSMGGKPAGMQQMQGGNGPPPMQPPGMMSPNNGVPPPPGTGGAMANMMMSPWQQGGMGMNQGQGGMNMGGMGPPPGMLGQGGNPQMGLQQGGMQAMPWMMQPPGIELGDMQMGGNPWQQQGNPQQGMGMNQVPGGGYPWMGYLPGPPMMGVPPPPPPPTSGAMGGNNSSAIDMNVLPNLLAAPPPPPPPS